MLASDAEVRRVLTSEKSRALMRRACAAIPGGVNSPARAWNAVGAEPLFIERSEGAYLYDRDGNRFIDYVGSFGPAIVGHAHSSVVSATRDQAEKGLSYGASTALEVELAETIKGAISVAQKVRLVSSGTEAGMTAIRLARAVTGRPLIVKFDGCYHGHSDSLLVRAGSGALTLGVPDSAGVPEAIASMTRVAAYNSIGEVEGYFDAERRNIAAIIVETVAANMGVVVPAEGFLRRLGDLAHQSGALLICDEVITGFRLRFGGGYELFGADPDLIMLGKVIGGGMPIGAIAGRAELMDKLAPLGPVYQAGTLAGNPIAVRAGLETLGILRQPGTYKRLEASSGRLEAGLREALKNLGGPSCVNRVGSLITIFFGIDEVTNAASARRADTRQFASFFNRMLARGVYLPPSQFEAMFVSLAHRDEIIDETISAAKETIAAMRKERR